MKIIDYMFPKKIIKPNIGSLCDCIGTINTTDNKECEYFPLIGGYHTHFLVGTCIKCGGLSGFPHYNLELATQQCSDSGKEILLQLGLKLLQQGLKL